MARPWTTLGRAATSAGELVLRRRGEHDFLISIDGRVLMTSAAHRSESALAEWACDGLVRGRVRVLIGGLGMGYTLRAALDSLGPDARVTVAELEECVVEWCRGPLAPLTGAAARDPRVELAVADVMAVVRDAADGTRPRFDAIAIDLFEGPRGTRDEDRHPLYGDSALASARAALTAQGVFAVWSEEPARGFEKRLGRAGFAVEKRRAGEGGRRHTLYRARPSALGQLHRASRSYSSRR